MLFNEEGTLKRGFIFIAADHRLIYPSTGFDIIEDMKALFSFLASPSFNEKHLPSGFTLDANRIAIMGASGGGYVARMAALYAQPKPRAVFSLFGMGGDFLSDDWVAPREGHFPSPRSELVTAETIAPFIAHPPPVASSAPIWFREDGNPLEETGRLNIFIYWWRSGELLDHVLGAPVSAKLRALPHKERLAAIPVHLHPIVAEANLDKSFPPTVLVHGLADSAVSPLESQVTYDRLKELGVKTELITVPRALHALLLEDDPTQMAPGAEEALARAMQFLEEELRR